jgi:hypothetical protein
MNKTRAVFGNRIVNGMPSHSHPGNYVTRQMLERRPDQINAHREAVVEIFTTVHFTAPRRVFEKWEQGWRFGIDRICSPKEE